MVGVRMAMTALKLPEHGGDLQWALDHFGGKTEDWLDLSTGISPWSWPVPQVPQWVWQHLPPVEDSKFRHAAATFYGCPAECVLPVPGSQFAIAHLPMLAPPGSVAVPVPGYREHARAWQIAGHPLMQYGSQVELASLIENNHVRHAVVINPNNPTGEVMETDYLRSLCHHLAHRDGMLVVDEAFGDCQPALSLAPSLPAENLIVLRSLGKFFGLAGVRLGFVLADPAWINKLSAWCQPWQVSGPAHWIGTRALTDRNWHTTQRIRLAQASTSLQAILQKNLGGFPEETVKNHHKGSGANLSAHAVTLTGSDLFVTLSGSASVLYLLFLRAAEQRMLLRFGHPVHGRSWLRIGLPGSSVNQFNARVDRVFSAMNNEKML